MGCRCWQSWYSPSPAIAWVDAERADTRGSQKLPWLWSGFAIFAVLAAVGSCGLRDRSPEVDRRQVAIGSAEHPPDREMAAGEAARYFRRAPRAIGARARRHSRRFAGHYAPRLGRGGHALLPLDQPEALEAIAVAPDGTYLLAGALRVEPVGGRHQRRHAFNSLIVLDDRAPSLHSTTRSISCPSADLPSRRIESLASSSSHAGAAASRSDPPPSAAQDCGPAPLSPFLIVRGDLPVRWPCRGMLAPRRCSMSPTTAGSGTHGSLPALPPSQVRAVEEGLPLVRNANNGLSAVVDRRAACSQASGSTPAA